MKPEHYLTDDAILLSQQMFLKGLYWVSYNSLKYGLGVGDLQFSISKTEAKAFVQNSIGENYKFIYASSIMDMINQLSYGNSIAVKDIDHLLKANFMNEENLGYLKESLKYLGFGDKLSANLEHHIRQGFPEFVLKTECEYGGSKLESTLFFSRPQQQDRYFLNRHDARLKNDVGTWGQSFYLHNGHGVTLKEAFNLLQGRAVYKEMNPKEGENYHAWIQLDFKNREENGNYKVRQFHDHYCYDLADVLFKLPIKELMDPQKSERLLQSLRKGNLQAVTMIVDGKDQKFSIHANPQYKTIDVYDYGAIKPLTFEQKAQLMMVEGRQKLNGKEVESEQPGKELKDGISKSQKNAPRNTEDILQKKGKEKRNGLNAH